MERFLNEPGFLGDDVDGEWKLADLGDEVFREGGVFVLLVLQMSEGGFEDIFFKTHGFEIGL